jgi:hypothetical protein
MSNAAVRLNPDQDTPISEIDIAAPPLSPLARPIVVRVRRLRIIEALW